MIRNQPTRVQVSSPALEKPW